MAPLEVARSAIVAFRRRVNGLEQRGPADAASLRRAAWAGCQDSVPRAAVLSLHARLDGISPDVLAWPGLVQVWGPGFSAYVVPAEDVAVFTLGRLPRAGPRRETALEMAAALAPVLADGPIAYREAGRRLGVDPNRLRYAALTGTVALQWAGAGPPTISALPAPEMDPADARRELGRRFLHVFGPATPADFASWAGVRGPHAAEVFDDLDGETISVRGPVGDGRLLASDEPSLRAAAVAPSGVRLLPSGDALYLLQGAQRELLVPDPARRRELWTSRVWPGALLVDGEICGTWRRAGARSTVTGWRSFSVGERERIEAAALHLPLTEQPIAVAWS